MKETPPIIFIHYGDSPYLNYVMKAAQITNPHKEIIFLGDEQNMKYKNLGISHYYFSEFENAEETELFKRVYQLVAGREHLSKHFAKKWLNFIFLRWFIIYNFIKEKKIEKFWTFDSDNLILSDLSGLESRFMDYDCTAQCNGSCMNGLINHQEVVKGYIDKINELFQRKDYLLAQQKEFDEINPSYAFTEMRAFEKYCEEENPKVFKLNTIFQQESFDDCIACSHDQMELYAQKFEGRFLKKLYIDSKNNIYSCHLPSQTFIKLHNLNMSWVPHYILLKIYKARFQKKSYTKSIQPVLIQIGMNPYERMKQRINKMTLRSYARLKMLFKKLKSVKDAG